MKKIYFSVFFASLIAVLSCNEQADNQPEPFSASSAMARFSSADEFKTMTDKIVSMTDSELDQWEKSKSFVSYRTVLKEAIAVWQQVESEEAQTSFIKKYHDIVKIENDELVPLISLAFYQAIVNREGMYETAGFVHKISGDFIITVDKKECAKLKGITLQQGNKVTIEKGVRVAQYTGQAKNIELSRTNAACSPEMVVSYFYNDTNCRHDRRVFMSVRSYLARFTNYEGDWWQPRVETKVYGHVRTSTFCRWETYMTTLYWKGVSYDINGWRFANNTITPASFSVSLPDYTSKIDEFHHTDDRAIGDRVLNHNISPAAFTRLHAEGSSRGVHGNWAVVDCQ